MIVSCTTAVHVHVCHRQEVCIAREYFIIVEPLIMIIGFDFTTFCVYTCSY